MDILQKIRQINESITLIINRLEKSGGRFHDIDRELLRQKLIAMYDLLESGQMITISEVSPMEDIPGKMGKDTPLPVFEKENVEKENFTNEESWQETKSDDLIENNMEVTQPELIDQGEQIEVKETIIKEEREEKKIEEAELTSVKEEPVIIKEEEKPETEKNEEKQPDKESEVITETEPVPEFKEDLFQAAQEQIRKKAVFEKFARQETSLNEKLAVKKEHVPLADSLQKGPIKDIRTAITLNMKLAFIRELYGGDQKEYNQMISFLTKCQNYTEAKLFLQEEKEKHPAWENKPELFEQLMTLIYRRFRL